MATPVQVSLEEIISMLLSRVDSLTANDENNKTKSNIIYRVLYKKGLITEEDIFASVKDEYGMLVKLGVIKDEPKEEMYQTITDGILQWLKCDVEGIKNTMAEYEKRVQEYVKEEEAEKPKIEVASANVLEQLDAVSGAKRPGGGKLII